MLMSTLLARQNSQFYCYFLNSKFGQTYFQLEGWGTAQTNISVPILQTIPVVVPPYHEQTQIVGYINEATAKVDSLTDKTREALAFLQEHRTALISAAVTGKIDVRHYVD
jgi:type I restriction enzyme S subunit